MDSELTDLVLKQQSQGWVVSLAAVLVNSKGEFLLCRRSMSKKVAPGKWHFPGGKVEGREDPLDCLVREVKEELSLDINKSTCRYLGVFFDYNSGGIPNRTYFVCATANGRGYLNGENDSLAWVKGEELSVYRPDMSEVYALVSERLSSYRVLASEVSF